jgi:hypothetical protein
MDNDKEWPVTLKVNIEADGLKRLAEKGRLMEFVSAFSEIAAAQMKAQLIEHLAEMGPDQAVNIQLGFALERDYGTGPLPWPPPWPQIERLGRT